jgi:exonuclease SbcC
MNPLRLTASSFRCFDSLDVELPVGTTAIVGENGAGKSSLVNLIDIALFGSRSMGDLLSDDAVEDDLVIGLEFEHRGELYRVRRTYSARGRGQTKVDFEQCATWERNDNLWQPLTRETAKETDVAIAELLGLSRETFRASAFLAQGDGAAFTEAQPRERKAILAEILGLSLWDHLHAKVRAESATIQTTVSGLVGKIELADHELGDRDTAIDERDANAGARNEAKEKLTEAEATFVETDERLTKARESEAARSAAQDLLASRQAVLRDVDNRLHDLSNEEAAIGLELSAREGHEAKAAGIVELENELARARAAALATEERARVTADLALAANKITVAETQEEATCDRCGQHMNAEAKATALISLTAEREALEHRLKELPEAVETRPVGNIEHDLAQARHSEAALVRLDERAKQLVTVTDAIKVLNLDLPRLEAEVKAAQDAFAAIPATEDMIVLGHQRNAAFGAVEVWRERYETADRALARCEERLQRLAQVESQLIELREQTETQRKELDVLALLERAFGRDGIPALIVENAACPQIELEANRILEELGTSFRVELRTQRALKSGEGLKEALDIIVLAPGGERPYETFSGGERTRLNLALRISLARLLAHRRGAEVRLLAIDEPEFLDEAGMERLASVLRGLLADFDRILLVSHHPTLLDQFDQVISVEKENGRSRIVDGATSDYLEVGAAA